MADDVAFETPAKKAKLANAEIAFLSVSDFTSRIAEIGGSVVATDGRCEEIVLSTDSTVTEVRTADVSLVDSSDASNGSATNSFSVKLRHTERQELIERDKDVREELPDGWAMLTHDSGMPVYVHRETGVCTLARPYQLGSRDAVKHDLPIAGIPCLVYQLEKEKQSVSDECVGSSRDASLSGTQHTTLSCISDTTARTLVTGSSAAGSPETVPRQLSAMSLEEAVAALPQQSQSQVTGSTEGCSSNRSGYRNVRSSQKTHITPQELNIYCRRLFDFKVFSASRITEEPSTVRSTQASAHSNVSLNPAAVTSFCSDDRTATVAVSASANNAYAASADAASAAAIGSVAASDIADTGSPGAVSEASPDVLAGCQSLPGSAGDHRFLDTDELLKLLASSPGLECVPSGVKDNVSFVIRNERNEDRRARGKRSQFSDNCGSWFSKGATTSRTAFVVGEGGELKTTVSWLNGLWGSRRFVNGHASFVPLSPQPSSDELLVLYRYYARLRSNPEFQRRISWVGQRPKSIPISVLGKAVYEYRGTQQCKPHPLPSPSPDQSRKTIDLPTKGTYSVLLPQGFSLLAAAAPLSNL